jgi:hypothetical protein
LAVTEQLGITSDQCTYTLVVPSTAQAKTHGFLEVAHADGDALVGPMFDLRLSPSFSEDRRYTLDELLTCLGFGDVTTAARPATRSDRARIP